MANQVKVEGLYYHVPFCDSICSYCDFAKMFYNEKMADEYLEALAYERSQYEIDTNYVRTIYIGGGTPSSLNINQLRKLFDIIKASDYPNLEEFTIEVNPESVTKEKIDLFVSNKINRISLGVQTFNEDLLHSINRKHTLKEIEDALSLLNSYNLDVSIDLMYGLEKQRIEDIKNDLSYLDKYHIKHLSAYSLILEEGTVLYNENYIKDESNDEVLEEYLHNQLNLLGYEHYEVSNYAKDNHYSKHNFLYWTSKPYLGLGLGASSYIDNVRFTNTRSITNYNKHLFNREYEYLDTLNKQLIDDIVVQFRNYLGIDLEYFKIKYSIDFKTFFESVIIDKNSYLYIKENKLYFTKKGQDYLNDVILFFIEYLEEK